MALNAPLGILTAVFFGIAILNYFMKFINKKYISKLGKDKKRIADAYRKIMRIIIKYHKVTGSIAIVCVLLHFYIAFLANKIMPSGVLAAIIMAIVFLLGIYGTYISKNVSGNWVKIHRVLAFVLLISIMVHIM